MTADALEIAVIIPSYNHSRYLPQCIDSVLAQTYPAKEVIVVDDGSQDDTREVVAAYGDRVRYVWRPNGGLAAARNTGVSATACAWIAFLDADDWWSVQKIERQVAALKACRDAEVCYTAIVFVDADGRRHFRTVPEPHELWPTLRYANPIPMTVLIRRDLLARVGGFDERMRACEDWDFWFRVGPEIRAVSVNEPLTMCRIVPQSLSRNVDLMLSNLTRMLDHTLLKDLRGPAWLYWRQKAWSAELARCAITAWDEGNMRARGLILRSLGAWPSPFFLPNRWKALAVYMTRRPHRNLADLRSES